MESIRECGICHNEIRNSRSLPCLHSFCLTCLQQLINSSNSFHSLFPFPLFPFLFLLPFFLSSFLPFFLSSFLPFFLLLPSSSFLSLPSAPSSLLTKPNQNELNCRWESINWTKMPIVPIIIPSTIRKWRERIERSSSIILHLEYLGTRESGRSWSTQSHLQFLWGNWCHHFLLKLQSLFLW